MRQTKEAKTWGKKFQKFRHWYLVMELDINILEYQGLGKKLKGIKYYCALGVLTSYLHKMGNVFQKKVRKRQESYKRTSKE